MSIDERSRLRELLDMHQRRLRILQIQTARYGADAPPHVQIEIDNLVDQIQLLERTLLPLAQPSPGWKAQAVAKHVVQSTPPLRSLRVFLCHASDDKVAVRALYTRLQDMEFHCPFREHIESTLVVEILFSKLSNLLSIIQIPFSMLSRWFLVLSCPFLIVLRRLLMLS